MASIKWVDIPVNDGDDVLAEWKNSKMSVDIFKCEDPNKVGITVTNLTDESFIDVFVNYKTKEVTYG